MREFFFKLFSLQLDCFIYPTIIEILGVERIVELLHRGPLCES